MKKKRNSSDSNGVTAPLLDSSDNPENENEERVIQPFILPDPEEELDPYPPNIIITSRYTIFSFLPKTIFEQFRRLANVYFLVLGMIAAIGANTEYYDTAVEPAGLLIPMTIVVFISILKDGVEDIKRHQTDQKTNNRHCRLVQQNGEVLVSEWKNVVVGSVLLLLGDDEVPADCIVLECGGVQGRSAYVETAAIDGETNLKLRLPSLPRRREDSNDQIPNISVTQDKSSVCGLDYFSISASVEKPNGSIHRFNGVLEVIEKEEGNNYRSQYPLSEKNLLLRGSILRASEWAICLVVYTGKETKLSLNSKTPPSKLSVVDSVVNRTLIIAISAMMIVCVISAVASIIWEIDNNNASYLCLSEDDLNDKYNGQGCESGSTNSALTILTFATLFNNFVCISMYVSLEMTYLWQAFFISQDLILYDETTDSPAEAHTSGMCADLGQVQYIFSDKTGTLTKNVMKLRRCSVAGMIFGEPMDTKSKIDLMKQSDSSKSRGISFESLLSDGVSLWSPLTDLNRFRTLPRSGDQRILLNFMRTMVLCNNAMLMPNQLTGELNVTDKDSLKACLEAESADEVALVLACAEHAGIILTKRDSTEAHVIGLDCPSPIDKLGSRSSDESDSRARSNTSPEAPPSDPSKEERVEILAINEFDSRRKRMSVVVRIGNGSPLLLCKGADSSMFPFCLTGPYTTQCKEHIDEFASSGLRTLVMAKRDLSEEQFQSWLASYQAASNSLVNRPEMLQRVAEEIESGMSLLGAVGIEDELQDGVSKTIELLSEARLNIWMITGDKAETAVAIGRMCGLLKPDHELELLLKFTGPSLKQRLDDLVHFFDQMGPEASGAPARTAAAAPSRESTRTMSTTISQVLMKAFAPMPPATGESAATLPQGGSMMDKSGTPKEAEISSGPSTLFLPSTLEEDSRSCATSFRSGQGGRRPLSISFRTALVVDGFVLEEIWRDKGLLQKFIAIARVVQTVIACRVSPLQKASLVRMIKTGDGAPVTLAIGDGANDIGMIHEAKIGVGICGNEGRHAANSSDFAIGQFRFLAPLLLKHGRYNYIRSSKLVLYSFFKNLLLVSTLFYYSTYSGFSGTMPLESIVFSGYNFYLGLPIIAIGMMDTDVSYEDVLRYPALAYATGKNRELLNLASMGRWCFSAFAEGSALFAIVVRYIGGNIEAGDILQGIGVNNLHGRAGGIYVEGFLMFCCVILAMQYKVALMTSLWTWIHVAAWGLSIAGFILFASVYSQIEDVWDWYHVVNFTFHQGVYWLSLLLIPVAIAMMDVFIDKAASLIAPSSQHRFHEILSKEAAGKNSSSAANFFFPSDKFVEKEIRVVSSESFVSGYISEDGVKLSTTPSDEGTAAGGWRESAH